MVFYTPSPSPRTTCTQSPWAISPPLSYQGDKDHPLLFARMNESLPFSHTPIRIAPVLPPLIFGTAPPQPQTFGFFQPAPIKETPSLRASVGGAPTIFQQPPYGPYMGVPQGMAPYTPQMQMYSPNPSHTYPQHAPPQPHSGYEESPTPMAPPSSFVIGPNSMTSTPTPGPFTSSAGGLAGFNQQFDGPPSNYALPSGLGSAPGGYPPVSPAAPSPRPRPSAPYPKKRRQARPKCTKPGCGGYQHRGKCRPFCKKCGVRHPPPRCRALVRTAPTPAVNNYNFYGRTVFSGGNPFKGGS